MKYLCYSGSFVLFILKQNFLQKQWINGKNIVNVQVIKQTKWCKIGEKQKYEGQVVVISLWMDRSPHTWYKCGMSQNTTVLDNSGRYKYFYFYNF